MHHISLSDIVIMEFCTSCHLLLYVKIVIYIPLSVDMLTKDEQCGDGFYVDREINGLEICTACNSLCAVEPELAFRKYYTCTGDTACIKWLKAKCDKDYIYDPVIDQCDVCNVGCSDEFIATRKEPCRILCNRTTRKMKSSKMNVSENELTSVLSLVEPTAASTQTVKITTITVSTVLVSAVFVIMLVGIVRRKIKKHNPRLTQCTDEDTTFPLYSPNMNRINNLQSTDSIVSYTSEQYGSQTSLINNEELVPEHCFNATCDAQIAEAQVKQTCLNCDADDTRILVKAGPENGSQFISLPTSDLNNNEYLQSIKETFLSIHHEGKIMLNPYASGKSNSLRDYLEADQSSQSSYAYTSCAHTTTHPDVEQMWDTKMPTVDTGKPAVETRKSVADTREPIIDTRKPADNTRRPTADTKQHASDMRQATATADGQSFSYQRKNAEVIYSPVSTINSREITGLDDHPSCSLFTMNSNNTDDHAANSVQSSMSVYSFKETHFLSTQEDAVAASNSLPPGEKPHIKNEKEHSQETAAEITRLPTKLKPIPNVQTVLQTLALNTWIKRMISNGKFIRIWFGGIDEINAKRIVSYITKLRQGQFDCIHV